MRALVLAVALALAGCAAPAPERVVRYAGHDHDGEAMRLDCEGCANALRGEVLRVLQAVEQQRAASVAPVGS